MEKKMPKQFQKSVKSLQSTLSKLKIPHKQQIQFPLQGCKHAKTTSFASAVGGGSGSGGGGGGKEKEKEDDGVTLSDIDQFLYENFKTLYQEECEEGLVARRNEGKRSAAGLLLESPRMLDPPPPANLCRSARFFVESGSASSRITDGPFSFSASSSSATASVSAASTSEEAEEAPPTAAEEDSSLAPDDFIALLTYSPSPYEDFRRSMQEMVEVRLEHNGKVDWQFLEELLFCYLDLNNKKSYRFILRAFVDVIVGLRENSGKSPAIPKPFSGGARLK